MHPDILKAIIDEHEREIRVATRRVRVEARKARRSRTTRPIRTARAR